MKNGLIVDEDGTEKYYKDNKLHREDGPAVIYKNGTEEWWLNNVEYPEDYIEVKMIKIKHRKYNGCPKTTIVLIFYIIQLAK